MKKKPAVISFDIGGTWIRVALASESRILATRATRWPFSLSPTEEINFIADFALEFTRSWTKSHDLMAAGVSLAALVDSDGSIVSWPNRPEWQQLPFKSNLESRLGVTIRIEDDANSAALAEWQFGAGQGYRSLLLMMVGTGVGGGLILNGDLFRGDCGWAAELGHLVMVPDGIECGCGNWGCLQTIASGRALERVALARNVPDVAALLSASDAGQTWASEELASCGRWLGVAAANVANFLSLQAVIIGGRITNSEVCWNALHDRFYSNLLNKNYRTVALHKATLGEEAGLIGATKLAWELVGRTYEPCA